MENDLKIIMEFLDRSGTGVEALSTPDPDSAEAHLLLRFASGGCTPAERTEACHLMQANRPLLRWVSDRVKSRRFAQPDVKAPGKVPNSNS